MGASIPKKDKIDLLYKNLQHITHANYSAEMAFPYWETLYALIIGQLIIAYFQTTAFITLYSWRGSARSLISFIGFVFTFSWFILVILNHIHSQYRYEKIRDLEKSLDGEYRTFKLDTDQSIACNLKFIPEDITKDDRETWLSIKKIVDTILYCKPKSTWVYRKLLPLILSLVWICLFCSSFLDP